MRQLLTSLWWLMVRVEELLAVVCVCVRIILYNYLHHLIEDFLFCHHTFGSLITYSFSYNGHLCAQSTACNRKFWGRQLSFSGLLLVFLPLFLSPVDTRDTMGGVCRLEQEWWRLSDTRVALDMLRWTKVIHLEISNVLTREIASCLIIKNSVCSRQWG